MRSVFTPFLQPATFLALTLCSLTAGQAQGLFINEVDCDSNTVPDSLEFVELFTAPNATLDGHVVVFYKGGGNTVTTNVYAAFDLDGMTADTAGFFLLANPGVEGADLIFEPGLLRDGGDAVALFEGDSADFPNGTPLTTLGLLDAVVYGTGDQTNPFLIDSLTPGQPQLDEWLYGVQNGGALAWARLPDGGPAFASDQMVLQQPTPGYTNLLDCDGGLISAQGGEGGTAQICVDLPGGFLPFTAQSNAIESQYGLVITNLQGEVLDVVPGGEGNLGYNFSGSAAGPCLVWGMSYDGDLDPSTIQVGAPYDSIAASGCVAFSAQPVEVERIFCLPPSCDGGGIFTAAGGDQAVGCMGFANTLVQFGYLSESPEAPYLFVITTSSGEILDSTSTPAFDFEGLGVGEYEVHGFSHLGAIDSSTFVPGLPVTALLADSCSALSYNHLDVSIQPCDPTGLCTDLFFSEYVDGTGFSKGLELYNPSASTPVDLSEYTVKTYNNGSSVPNHELDLSGTLAPGEVLTIVNPQAVPALTNLADILDDVTLFNGNDATTLERNGQVVDVLGEVGVNPGSDGWPVNGITMLHNTLVRIPEVTSGSADWDEVDDQWFDHPENTFEFFGSHEALPCGLDTTAVPILGFGVSEILAFEGDVVGIELPVSLPLQDVQVQIDVAAGNTATPVADFGTLFPVNLTFPQGWLSPQSLAVGIVDDFEPEGVETFTLVLTVLSGEAEVTIDSLTITIAPNDLGFPHYPIADVRGIDGNGVLDSLLVPCELRGVVHGFNTYPSGLRFTIIDPTAGIEVFSPVENFNYLVQEGDSVRIRGTVQQFQGLAQIIVDTLILSTVGEELQEPELVNALDEETESALIRLKCVELVDPANWTNAMPQFEVYVSTGAALYLMVVDADTDLFGSEPPVGVFGVTGIGGQRDFEAPFVDGYTILPRSAADISEPVEADFFVEDPWYAENGPVPFENLSSGAGSYFWTFGDGTPPDTTTSPFHEYAEESTYTVVLTAQSQDGVCSDQSVQEVTVVFTDTSTIYVGEIDVQAPFEFGPNPFGDAASFVLTTAVDLDHWGVTDALGRSCFHGGVVRKGGRIVLESDRLETGWYILRMMAADGRDWSVRLVCH